MWPADSPRKQACREAFRGVDCGAVPRELAASEFFGQSRVRYGSRGRQDGRLRSRERRHALSDEVGNLSYETQVQLLRALQERRIRPVGGSREIPVDIRLYRRDERGPRSRHRARCVRAPISITASTNSRSACPNCGRCAGTSCFSPTSFSMRRTGSWTSGSWASTAGRRGHDPLRTGRNLRQMKNAVMSATLLCTGDYITCRELPAELSEAPETPAVPLRNPAGEEEQIRRALAMAGATSRRQPNCSASTARPSHKLHLYGIE